MVVITSTDRDVLRDAVRGMYTEVARDPDQGFHFPTGRAALELEGYDPTWLDRLPQEAVASFAGVACPFVADVIRRGDAVLDVGSGSGTDALIAAELVGPEGEVIGLDMTRAMRERLAGNAARAGAGHVRVLEGDAEAIPLGDGRVDVVTTNGVLNLVPDKARAVGEIHRVLRPGGRVQVADIVLQEDPSPACRSQPRLWAECIVGATTESDYLAFFRDGGFEDVEVLDRVDYFAHSPNEGTRELAHSLGARAIVLRGRRG